MLIKINRLEAINKYPILPTRYYDVKKDEETYYSPKVYANYVLTLPSKSHRGNQKLLGNGLSFILKELGYDHFVFLGDIDIAWLRRFGQVEKFHEGFQYFLDHKIGKRFNGAIQVKLPELHTFVTHLSFLVRINGIVQYVHFTDPGQNIVADICQYGNLHISTRSKKIDIRFKNIIAKSQFTYLPDRNCINRFSKGNVIKGRSVKI